MADITSPPVISFCNDYARPGAELLIDVYYALGEWLAEFNAGVASDPEFVAAANGDTFVDGSPADGRLPFTKAQVNGLKGLFENIRAEIDTIVTWEDIASAISVRSRGKRVSF